MLSVSSFLTRNTTCYPGRTAIVCGDTELTYAQLNEKSGVLAAALYRIGIRQGDRVALLLRSSIEWVLFWHACQKLGAAPALIHVKLLNEELIRAIELADVTALVYSDDFAEKAAAIAGRCPRVKALIGCGSLNCADGSRGFLFSELMNSGCRAGPLPDIEVNEHDPCVIMFTSGTSGPPKGIVRTQGMFREYALVMAVSNGSGSDPEVIITPAPLYHASGLSCMVKALILAGTLILVDGFNCDLIGRQTEQYRATQVLLVPPSSYQRLYATGVQNRYDLTSIKKVLLKAGKCTRECCENIFEMFPNASVCPSWGSTEISNATYICISRDEMDRFGTIGKANCLTEIRLLDENGNEVPCGVPGEAHIRSPLVFSGYIKEPERTRKTFRGRWFNTEDILRRDEDGYYYLMDRKQDLIKTGGENVYAQEVERAISGYPCIQDCAVVGIPDARFEEAVAAAIVLKKGCSIDPQDFLTFCRSVLPSFKKPRYWAIMDRLPVNDIGKVQKNVLRANASLFSEICC